MLTRKQYELLIFVNKYLNEQGVSPSFDEMKDALGLRSKSGIHRLMMGLEERGFIRRLPHRARALEVLRLPDNVAPKPRGQNRREAPFAPNVIKGDFKPEVGRRRHHRLRPVPSACRATGASPPVHRLPHSPITAASSRCRPAS